MTLICKEGNHRSGRSILYGLGNLFLYKLENSDGWYISIMRPATESALLLSSLVFKTVNLSFHLFNRFLLSTDYMYIR